MFMVLSRKKRNSLILQEMFGSPKQLKDSYHEHTLQSNRKPKFLNEYHGIALACSPF
jgi:hypothetical protein